MRWKSRRGAGAAHRHEASRADTRSLAAVGALERGDPPPPRLGGSNPDPQRVFLAGGAQLAGGNEADSRATGPSGTAADSEITTCKKCLPSRAAIFDARAARPRTCAWHGGLGSAALRLHRENHS